MQLIAGIGDFGWDEMHCDSVVVWDTRKGCGTVREGKCWVAASGINESPKSEPNQVNSRREFIWIGYISKKVSFPLVLFPNPHLTGSPHINCLRGYNNRSNTENSTDVVCDSTIRRVAIRIYRDRCDRCQETEDEEKPNHTMRPVRAFLLEERRHCEEIAENCYSAIWNLGPEVCVFSATESRRAGFQSNAKALYSRDCGYGEEKEAQSNEDNWGLCGLIRSYIDQDGPE